MVAPSKISEQREREKEREGERWGGRERERESDHQVSYIACKGGQMFD